MPAFAADPRLDLIRQSLVPLREQKAPVATRGATPQFTVIKHQLRDWAESRLTSLIQTGDEGAFERKLNSELRDGGLSCGWNTGDPKCPDWYLMGYLEDLKFRRSGVFLIVQTGVGIECGFDESAYIYSWSDEGWRRVWQNEQNDYTEKTYKTLTAVLISLYSQANDYLVLTLGTESWCSSNWHDVYYRGTGDVFFD